jgi:hypothetical protein
MPRSTDITNERYAGWYLRQWTIIDGYPTCVLDALDTRTTDPATVAGVEAVNAVIAERMAAVEAYEAAVRVNDGDVPPADTPEHQAYWAALTVIDSASDLTKAYATVRVGAPPEPAAGEVSGAWDAYQAAVALIEANPITATPSTEDLAQTFEQQRAAYGAAITKHMDAVVQTRGYDGIHTCVTYAGEASVPQYQAEGLAARAWRSEVWAAVYAILADVEAGNRAPLSVAELLAELPPLEWPA